MELAGEIQKCNSKELFGLKVELFDPKEKLQHFILLEMNFK